MNKIITLPPVKPATTPKAPRGDLSTAATALREMPALQLLVAFDDFARRPMLVKPGPWEFDPHSFEPRPWESTDDLRLTEYLQQSGIPVKPRTVGEAVELVARERSFNPVIDYLDSVEHDGLGRVDHFFQKYFGADDSPYSRSVSRCFLIGSVARVMCPGVKNDHLPVLESAQGEGKSTALKVMFQPWFSDELADFGSKDAALQLMGIWCHELSEMDAYSRAEVGRVKAWISRTVDRFRPPYGYRVAEFPRSCVFAGTTNRDEYLRDETGNRRFWPLKTGKINLTALGDDRDQIWAEAVRLYRADVKWWLINPEALRQAKAEQLARVVSDPWEAIVADYTADKNQVSTPSVLSHAIGLPVTQHDQKSQNRVAACLINQGWTRFQVRTGDKRRWDYRRPA
ncbi:VapE domain-containing protein [Bradyrhizobium sp. USDA 3364]